MNKSKILIIILFITILFLTILQVVVSNHLSTVGIDVAKLDQDLKRYKKENALLKEQILQESSLTRIASVSSKIGFIPSRDVVYLRNNLPLAVKR